MAQAHALDAIFGHCTRRAALNMGEHPRGAEMYLRLALRAQSPARGENRKSAEQTIRRRKSYYRTAEHRSCEPIDTEVEAVGEIDRTNVGTR